MGNSRFSKMAVCGSLSQAAMYLHALQQQDVSNQPRFINQVLQPSLS